MTIFHGVFLSIEKSGRSGVVFQDLEDAAGDRDAAAVSNDLRGGEDQCVSDADHARLCDQKLADLDMELGNPTEAIREYNAVLALKPVDPAGTHYSLAKAYQAVHKNNEAMDEVLSSLEIAPGFRDAQKLLLELNKESSK